MSNNYFSLKTGNRVLGLSILLAALVFMLAWVSRKPSIETDGRGGARPVAIITIDTLDLATPAFHPITIDLKINGQDQAADVQGKKYKTKWKSSGADSCLMLSPIEKALSLSGSEIIEPSDSSLYPHHDDGLMVIIRCLNRYTESADTVYIFS